MGKKAVFLDFDGVVCDSLPECFYTSWAAFYDETKAVDVLWEEYRFFCALRPLVKNGEEYLVIQKELYLRRKGEGFLRNFSLEKLPALDLWEAHLNEIGKEELLRLETVFTETRKRLLAEERNMWLRMNPFYPGLKSVLEKLLGCDNAFILSTKVSSFIYEIIKSQGIDWPVQRILYAGGEKEKKAWLDEWLSQNQTRRAIFIDDHPAHLRRAGTAQHYNRLDLVQALWGYGDIDKQFTGWTREEMIRELG